MGGRHVRTRIVRIGNSQGVRIPKALLEECGLSGDVDMTVRDGSLVISSAAPRQDWADAFREMALQGDDALLDADAPLTSFDEESWEWR
jgi:antitoxin MazE